ncbi:uncharacterized protein LOC129589499 [Paramacrobiotus metropolitanus]|uniref:uncharacterized protein LOC129589499 n=1 Tax=Paramacrobiotus metropolitanus TaxID=2943436 RepID=UPI0024462269|nr:uncharacterized protein LOC129589499 [Paramacrobiotus metropolitanus]
MVMMMKPRTGMSFRARRRTGTPAKIAIAVKKAHLDLNRENARAQAGAWDMDLRNILNLEHPNLVRHLAHQNAQETGLVDVPNYVIIMEYCSGGTLHAAAKYKIPAALFQKWTHHIVDGLTYLHSKKIVHRDIKGINILLSSADWNTCQIKIADLGAIKRLLANMTQAKEVSHDKGTWAFMSPEMIMGNDIGFNIGRKTDIWSFGCVVLEMISGFPRFVKEVDGKQMDLKTDLAAMYYIGSGGSPIIPSDIPNELRDFVADCLSRDPEKRPGASELLVKPFMTMTNAPQWPDMLLGKLVVNVLCTTSFDWLKRYCIMASAADPTWLQIPYPFVEVLSATPVVYLAHRTEGLGPGEIVIKQSLLGSNREKANEQADALDADLRHLLSLNHPYLVRHLAHCHSWEGSPVDVAKYRIIMEYCCGGNLHAAAQLHIAAPLVQKWTSQILAGLAYLHAQHIVHRDLTGTNILLSSPDWDTCQMKIGRLDASKRLVYDTIEAKEVPRYRRMCAFMSPEMINDDDTGFNIGRKTDIWSFGCVLLEMVSGFSRFVKEVNGNQVDLKNGLSIMYYVGCGRSPVTGKNVPPVPPDIFAVSPLPPSPKRSIGDL